MEKLKKNKLRCIERECVDIVMLLSKIGKLLESNITLCSGCRIDAEWIQKTKLVSVKIGQF
jgi:hypothetical protein